MKDLGGRVAVITGAASGLGVGLAKAFASRGMKLVLADIDERGVAAVAEAFRDDGIDAVGVAADVRDGASVEALADAAWSAFGAAHVVCNNAGVFTVGPQWEATEAQWRWVLDVNVMGVVHGVRSFVPRLIEQGDGGHIVNTASVGGLVATPLIGPYGASKHAVVGLSKGLRADLALLEAPIGVTVVCPGAMSTAIVEHLRQRTEPGASELVQWMLGRLQSTLDEGMDPDVAGALVAAAVEADRFWVVPNGASELDDLRHELEELFAAPTR